MRSLRLFRPCAWLLLAALPLAGSVALAQQPRLSLDAVRYTLADDEGEEDASPEEANDIGEGEFKPSPFRPANFLQPQPARVPQRQVVPDTAPTATGQLTRRTINLPTSLLTQGVEEPNLGPATQSVASGEAR